MRHPMSRGVGFWASITAASIAGSMGIYNHSTPQTTLEPIEVTAPSQNTGIEAKVGEESYPSDLLHIGGDIPYRMWIDPSIGDVYTLFGREGSPRRVEIAGFGNEMAGLHDVIVNLKGDNWTHLVHMDRKGIIDVEYYPESPLLTTYTFTINDLSKLPEVPLPK